MGKVIAVCIVNRKVRRSTCARGGIYRRLGNKRRRTCRQMAQTGKPFIL